MLPFTFDQFGAEVIALAGGSIILAVDGVVKIKRARRVHYVGRISDAAYHAEVTLGVSSIVFLPVLIAVTRWLGPLAGLVLTFVALGVAVWAGETVQDSDSARPARNPDGSSSR